MQNFQVFNDRLVSLLRCGGCRKVYWLGLKACGVTGDMGGGVPKTKVIRGTSLEGPFSKDHKFWRPCWGPLFRRTTIGGVG